MSHWFYYGAAFLNLLIYVYSEPRPMLLLGVVILVVYGTGERVINYLKEGENP